MLLTLLTLYFVLQLALPVRHYFIEGDVLWTEEGHRMSWRMMLRSRSGNLQFRVVDKESGEGHLVNLREWLTSKQRRKVQTHPDFIWQFSQHLKKQYAAKGKEISVFVVDSEQKVKQVMVTTGIGSGDRIEVNGDLSDGNTVVIRGNERLRPGQSVSIMED